VLCAGQFVCVLLAFVVFGLVSSVLSLEISWEEKSLKLITDFVLSGMYMYKRKMMHCTVVMCILY